MQTNNFQLKNRFVFIFKSPVLSIENGERTISPFIKASKLPKELNEWVEISKHVIFGDKNAVQPVEILRTQWGVHEGRKIILIFDEEGKYKDDEGISLLLSDGQNIHDYIVGNIIAMVFDENLHEEWAEYGVDGIDGMDKEELNYFHDFIQDSFVNTVRINRNLTEDKEVCCNAMDINKK